MLHPAGLSVGRVFSLSGASAVARDRKPTAFGRRLRELREERGLSQQALERLTGIAHQSIYQYEHGTASPNWTTVLRLADALGVNVGEFRGPEDQGEELPEKKNPAKKN